MINPTPLNSRQWEEKPAQFAFLPLSRRCRPSHIIVRRSSHRRVVLILKSIWFVQILNKWRYANIQNVIVSLLKCSQLVCLSNHKPYIFIFRLSAIVKQICTLNKPEAMIWGKQENGYCSAFQCITKSLNMDCLTDKMILEEAWWIFWSYNQIWHGKCLYFSVTSLYLFHKRAFYMFKPTF